MTEIWLKRKEGTLYNPMGKIYQLMINGEENRIDHFFGFIKVKNS